MESTGKRLKALLNKLRLKQNEIAVELKITEQSVSGYTRSETLGVGVIENICNAVFKLTNQMPNREWLQKGKGEMFTTQEKYNKIYDKLNINSPKGQGDSLKNPNVNEKSKEQDVTVNNNNKIYEIKGKAELIARMAQDLCREINDLTKEGIDPVILTKQESKGVRSPSDN